MSNVPFADIKGIFPNMSPLDAYFRDHESYKTNVYRRMKILLFWNVLSTHAEFNDFAKEDKYDITIAFEVACYNMAIAAEHALHRLPSWQQREYVLNYSTIVAGVLNDMMSNYKPLSLLSALAEESMGDKLVSLKKYLDYLFYHESDEVKHIISQRTQPIIKVKTTSLYTCEKCGHKKCSAKPVQTRAADEGADIRIRCVECAFEWTERG